MSLARVMILVELFVFTGFVVGYGLLQRSQGKKRLDEFPIKPLLLSRSPNDQDQVRMDGVRGRGDDE